MEKKGARIPTPPNKLTQLTRRSTVKRENVQNTRIFTQSPMPTPEQSDCDGPLLEVKKGYAHPDFVSNSPQARFDGRAPSGESSEMAPSAIERGCAAAPQLAA